MRGVVVHRFGDGVLVLTHGLLGLLLRDEQPVVVLLALVESVCRLLEQQRHLLFARGDLLGELAHGGEMLESLPPKLVDLHAQLLVARARLVGARREGDRPLLDEPRLLANVGSDVGWNVASDVGSGVGSDVGSDGAWNAVTQVLGRAGGTCAGWCDVWKKGGWRIAAGKTISFQNGA